MDMDLQTTGQVVGVASGLVISALVWCSYLFDCASLFGIREPSLNISSLQAADGGFVAPIRWSPSFFALEKDEFTSYVDQIGDIAFGLSVASSPSGLPSPVTPCPENSTCSEEMVPSSAFWAFLVDFFSSLKSVFGTTWDFFVDLGFEQTFFWFLIIFVFAPFYACCAAFAVGSVGLFVFRSTYKKVADLTHALVSASIENLVTARIEAHMVNMQRSYEAKVLELQASFERRLADALEAGGDQFQSLANELDDLVARPPVAAAVADRLAALEARDASVSASSLPAADLVARVDTIEHHSNDKKAYRATVVSEMKKWTSPKMTMTAPFFAAIKDLADDDVEGVIGAFMMVLKKELNELQAAKFMSSTRHQIPPPPSPAPGAYPPFTPPMGGQRQYGYPGQQQYPVPGQYPFQGPPGGMMNGSPRGGFGRGV